MEIETLHQVVRRAEENLLSGTSRLGEYVDRSMHDTIERIFAYLNSRFTGGQSDALGRQKPFFNIVSAAVNIWFRATDLDRKDIVVLPDNSSNVVGAFLATVLLQRWMKKAKFGVFLNQWGRTLAQYGSAIVKFVDRGDELSCSVVPWNRAIVDPIDFYALPRIEKLFKTPAQLVNMATESHPDYVGYNMDAVKQILDDKKPRENLRSEQKDNLSEFIEIYEVHGEMSRAVYKKAKGEEVTETDNEVFFQQMHVISWVKGDNAKGKYTDLNLYCGKEKKDPYMITHLMEEDGQTLSIGAVEYLFDAQWMANHTMKAWKDQMDLASKLVFQTADQNLKGKNVLTNIEIGDIFYHAPNMPVEQFPNIAHDIGTIQNFLGQWQALGREVTSTPDAARGNNTPSGQPLGATQLITAQGLSLFEVMTENKGLALEQMLREFVIPFLKTKMDNQDEVMAILDDHNIKKIDAMYVPRAAVKLFNNRMKKEMLAGNAKNLMPFDQQAEEGAVKQSLSELGNMRPLSPGDVTWKEVLKDLEWELDVQITNEQIDKQATSAVLLELMKISAGLAGRPMTPDERLLFNKILSVTSVVSPIELSAVAAQPSPIQPQETGNLAVK